MGKRNRLLALLQILFRGEKLCNNSSSPFLRPAYPQGMGHRHVQHVDHHLRQFYTIRKHDATYCAELIAKGETPEILFG